MRKLPLHERLTDQGLKAKVPLYARGAEAGADHKCGDCSRRVLLDGDRAYCTLMHGEISLGQGSCTFWARGAASKFEDIAVRRLSKTRASYTEVKGSINCGSCEMRQNGPTCALWGAEVALGDRCLAWTSTPSIWRGSAPLSERWGRALDEGVGEAFTDRYDALGIPIPNPESMCKAQCEGTGFVPVSEDDPEEPWRALWLQAESQAPTEDGWHFVSCPTCEGTGLASPYEKQVAEAAELDEDDTPAVRAAKSRLTDLLRR